MVAGAPKRDIDTPESVRALAPGQEVRPIWENELGGLVFAVGDGPDRYVKWAPAGSALDLSAEASRLRWAAGFTTVPRVVEHGKDAFGSWLVTIALPGDNAIAERWRADPAAAVAAIGRGLRDLHDTLPVEECPFTWTVEDRLAYINAEAAKGRINPAVWTPDFADMTLEDVLALLNDPPHIDRLVVCHGDPCAPNTLINDDGNCLGHVDLGTLGIADQWADLAVATWSTVWNYGSGWEEALLAAYGVDGDAERTRYYRLLWALGP